LPDQLLHVLTTASGTRRKRQHVFRDGDSGGQLTKSEYGPVDANDDPYRISAGVSKPDNGTMTIGASEQWSCVAMPTA